MKYVMVAMVLILMNGSFAQAAEVVATCSKFQIVADNDETLIVWPTDEKSSARLTSLGSNQGPTKSFYAQSGDQIIFVNFTTSTKSSLVQTFNVVAGETGSTPVETCDQ